MNSFFKKDIKNLIEKDFKTFVLIVIISTFLLFTILFVCLQAYVNNRSDDPLLTHDMYEILTNEDLLIQYKQTHKYLDDMVYIPCEESELLETAGYSAVWQVFSAHEKTANGVQEKIYYNCESETWYKFLDTTGANTDYFYKYFIPFFCTTEEKK